MVLTWGNQMTTDAMASLVDDKFDNDSDKAELTALILNSINPTETNLVTFFDQLDDSIHDELISRAAAEEDRLNDS